MIQNQNTPNYVDGSLVNLMSSIIQYYGGSSKYAPLKELPLSQLEGTKNVVLILLDGMGYNFFIQNMKRLKSPLKENLIGKIEPWAIISR